MINREGLKAAAGVFGSAAVVVGWCFAAALLLDHGGTAGIVGGAMMMVILFGALFVFAAVAFSDVLR